ncbi:hypothetical protein PZ897_15970 [Hoeflea sp. YIM 152468]|uniref:hypothetical protein n=1 Tax=Hoeflea sp. YIM 152468 TaxID=3031759 RepID=UPI0023DC2F8D|nr:hypothetical protein [Hoeflea sp. YIM 152468]MDF1609684.1 hypothetical protein [Hoeflea sp. YIM 152468]
MPRIKIIGIIGATALGLAGCNSTEQTLQPIPGDAAPSALTSDSQTPVGIDPVPGADTAPFGQPATGQPAAGTAAAPAQNNATLPAGQVRGQIRFMPVIGAPVNAVTPLSRQLAAEARNRGLSILSASDPGGDHVLKGYFSADSFDGTTTVYYVWDILDATGNRLNRIQGQEQFPGSSGDPWASVPAEVMERIAARSLADYAAWRGL